MSTTQMSTMEVGKSLVDLCRQGKNHEAMETHYAADIVSIEAGAPDGQSREAHGLDAVLAKGQWWSDNHEVHSAVINGPFPHDDRFIVHMKYDVTFKPTGKRFPMEEGALYTVRDGKIVHEEFFYNMG